jgi:hypothetical protein
MVRAEIGNAKTFMCPYHGWTYANDGPLVYVPGEQEAYYSELKRECLGLVAARVIIMGVDSRGITARSLLDNTWRHAQKWALNFLSVKYLLVSCQLNPRCKRPVIQRKNGALFVRSIAYTGAYGEANSR